ncbi:MAG: alpha-mannosidase, partial [Bacteroidetes bacterium]|nr:alpha-mannosidase [Bacteroidota bacterium]
TTAYKPKTFGVKLKKGAVELPQSLNIPVALDYNNQAFTPDAFRNTGRFDKDGNSYSADLIGKSVVSDGITFNIAAVDVNNVVKCKKNIVRLPENNQCTKLYILASSVDKDRKATFKVDGKQYTFQVPYYSGFYGQWGQTGFSEGYVKDASLAYVGSHRHTRKGNEAYTFTYMFKFCISLPEGAKELELPDDENIAVFAATLSNNSNDDVKPACEMRALTLQK